MRAVLIEELEYPLDKMVNVTGESFHHLKNVLRVKEGKEILLLNGKGLKANAIVKTINKKNLELEVNTQEELESNSFLDVLVGKVKKDAMDLVLKQCCELKIRKIIIADTKYSQRYDFNTKRTNALLKSAVEQSNILYSPEIVEADLSALKGYDRVIYFSSIGTKKQNDFDKNKNTILVFGPEGGLDEEEEAQILSQPGSSSYFLDTGIMRTSTAISCGVGFYLGAISQKN